MKTKLLFVAVLLFALSLSASALTLTYGARVDGNTGADITWSPGVTNVGFANSSTGCLAAGCGTQHSVYSSTAYAGRYLQYSNLLPIAGYYEVCTAFGNVNQDVAKTDVRWTITHAGGSTAVIQNQTIPADKNQWMTVGTYKFLSTQNAIVKMDRDNANPASGSMYNHSIQYRSATPGAAVYTGPANGATGELMDFVDLGLSWTAGAYNMAYDIWFGDDANNLTKIVPNYSGFGMGLDPDSLAPGNTYFWRVDALNVDKIATGEVWSFTINAVPEPGSMLALGTGLIGLFGIIRRKKS